MRNVPMSSFVYREGRVALNEKQHETVHVSISFSLFSAHYSPMHYVFKGLSDLIMLSNIVLS